MFNKIILKNKKIVGLLTIIIMLIGIVAILANCSSQESTPAKKETVKVIATTTIIADLIENIGGEKIDVEVLMGPGIDPHLYKASAGDVKLMQEADLIVYNGLHLEGKMGDVLEQINNQGIKTIAVAEQIDEANLLTSEDSAGQYDPHIWSNVKLWMKAAKAVRDKLMEVNPREKETYQQNTKEYLIQLKKLNSYIKKQVSKVPKENRILITAHDAFNYFGEKYKFDVKALQGITTTSEAGTADVKELANFIADNEIPAIFIESSVPEKNIKALQEAVKAQGVEVTIGGELYSDALGDPDTPEGTYLGMIRHNVDTIINSITD